MHAADDDAHREAEIAPRVIESRLFCLTPRRHDLSPHVVVVPAGVVVGENPELDAARFRRTANGVCLVTQAMLDKLI